MTQTPDDDGYFVVASPRTSVPSSLPPGAGQTVRRGTSLWSVVAVVLGAALAVGGGVTWVLSAPDRTSVVEAGSDAGAGLVAAVDTPEPGPGPEPDPAVVGYDVWARNADGTPVRWNPCEPISYVLNPDGAPPGAEADLARATGLVTAASGLRFRYEGRTDEVPTRDRSPYQRDRYGDRWAPVLVSWTSPADADVPMIASDRGVSIPVAVGDGEADVFVSGQIVLNPDRPLVSGFADRQSSWGATLLHELGHVVGLDHVDDPRQIMYTFPGRGSVTFAHGDLAGLQEVGAGACLDVPDPVDVDVRFVEDFGT